MRASVLSVLGTFAITLTLMLSSPVSAQDETWLDGDLASWNTPGMAIPAAPTIDGYPSVWAASVSRWRICEMVTSSKMTAGCALAI